MSHLILIVGLLLMNAISLYAQEAVEADAVAKAAATVESVEEVSDTVIAEAPSAAAMPEIAEGETAVTTPAMPVMAPDTTMPTESSAAPAKPHELPVMDKEGVFPSLVHKGDIVDFLKVLGVTTQRNIIPSDKVKGYVQVTLYNVTFEEAMNSVLTMNGYIWKQENSFIYVFSKDEFAEMELKAKKMQSRLFQLNYLQSGDVLQVVKPLMSQDGQITTNSTSAEKEKWAGKNYVVVNDYPENLKMIEETLSKLDERPKQVLVEATILSAKLTDETELGVDFRVLGGVDFMAENGAVDSVPEGQVGLDGLEGAGGTEFTSKVSNGGLSIGIVKNNIGMFIKALESVTDIVAIGNPKVLALNRHEGKVIVGGEQGYVTTETSTTSTTQSVENLSTGTILRFTPYVMDDGYIRMELHPEDSSGEVVVKGNFALPEKTTAEVVTNVLVQDGYTIVIGGLFRDKTTIARSQIPLLGNIPLLGTLFRSSKDTVEKEELIFLITPHVVSEPQYSKFSARILQEYDKKMLGIEERLLWFGRSRLAKSHYQQALKDLAAGKQDSALWHAQQASQMNPMLLDALRLQDELKGYSGTQAHHGWMNNFMQSVIQNDETLLFERLPLRQEIEAPSQKPQTMASDNLLLVQ